MKQLTEIKVDKKKVSIGQYVFEDFNNAKEIDVYSFSKAIGYFIISFSQLEKSLNEFISQSINDRADSEGFRILSFLSFKNKIDYFDWIAKESVSFQEDVATKAKRKGDIKYITAKLRVLNTFRNSIAHASWEYIDEDGYVLTKTEQDKEDGSVVFEKVKFTNLLISKFERQNKAIANQIDMFED